MSARQKISPYLWFNDNAEEAINFYVSIFADAQILNLARYPEDVPNLGGKAMSITFQLEGQKFMALNGGPMFQFTEAISLFVDCETQAEVDDLWANRFGGPAANASGAAPVEPGRYRAACQRRWQEPRTRKTAAGRSPTTRGCRRIRRSAFAAAAIRASRASRGRPPRTCRTRPRRFSSD